MHILSIILFVFCLTACHYKNTVSEKQLQDTLELLRKKADYKPLKEADAYAFINRYYLPKLDTLPIGRKIFIYPLTVLDFHSVFKNDSMMIRAVYMGDTAYIKKHKFDLYPPPNYRYNQKLKWDFKKFEKTSMVVDSFAIALSNGHHSISYEEREAWYKAIKPGYMMVAYPQYNVHINRLIISEWIENANSCGTGRDNKYVSKRVPGGWQEIK